MSSHVTSGLVSFPSRYARGSVLFTLVPHTPLRYVNDRREESEDEGRMNRPRK